MNEFRYIKCSECGQRVRIPWLWIAGIEVIFRCRGCGKPYRTGYKMGAFLSAVALGLSIVAANLLIFVSEMYFLPLFVLLVVPLWLFCSFRLRRRYMIWRCGIRNRKDNANSSQEDVTE